MIEQAQSGRGFDERGGMPAHAMIALALLPGLAVTAAKFLPDGFR